MQCGTYLDGVAHPKVRLAGERELGRAQRMRDVFDRVGEAVRKVIGGVDEPLVACSHVWLVEHTVCDDVPHVRVARLHVHLHAERGFTRLVRALAHLFKLAAKKKKKVNTLVRTTSRNLRERLLDRAVAPG